MLIKKQIIVTQNPIKYIPTAIIAINQKISINNAIRSFICYPRLVVINTDLSSSKK